MAKALSDMILTVYGKQNAASNAGIDIDDKSEPVISHEEMTHIMRLAMAVHTDQNEECTR